MTRLETLKELAKKVEAGGDGHGWFCPLWHEDGLCVEAESAYHGSLDAAKALHEAVLPEHWHATVMLEGAARIDECGVDGVRRIGFHGSWPARSESNPARAWLLAILRALIAQEEIA